MLTWWNKTYNNKVLRIQELTYYFDVDILKSNKTDQIKRKRFYFPNKLSFISSRWIKRKSERVCSSVSKGGSNKGELADMDRYVCAAYRGWFCLIWLFEIYKGVEIARARKGCAQWYEKFESIYANIIIRVLSVYID